MRRAAATERDDAGEVVILSYDEKPGIQAIGNITPDLPPFLAPTPLCNAIMSTSATAS